MPNGPGYGENIGKNPAPGPNKAQRFFGDPRFASLIEALAPLLISKLGGGPDMGYGALQGIQGQQDYRRQLGQDQLRREQMQEEQRQRQDALRRATLQDEEMRFSRAQDDFSRLLPGMDNAEDAQQMWLKIAQSHNVPTVQTDRYGQMLPAYFKGRKTKATEGQYYVGPKGQVVPEDPAKTAQFGTGEMDMMGYDLFPAGSTQVDNESRRRQPAKPDTTSDPNSYKEYVLEVRDGGFKGNYSEWQTMDANRRRQPEVGQYLPLTNEAGQVIAAWNPKAGKVEKLPEGLAGARKSGLPTEERIGLAQIESVDAVIDDIEKYSKKVHTSEGILARGGGFLREIKGALGYDPDITALKSKIGELSLLVRQLGEKGALAEGDVQRAIALVPTNPKLTVTEATDRLRDLRMLLKRAREARIKAAGGGEAGAGKGAGGTTGGALKDVSTEELLKRLLKK